jgi:hypothetical protein
VTLQVGMVSHTGIVIVGDTWQYVDPARDQKIWVGYHASKLRVSASGRIAVASARVRWILLCSLQTRSLLVLMGRVRHSPVVMRLRRLALGSRKATTPNAWLSSLLRHQPCTALCIVAWASIDAWRSIAPTQLGTLESSLLLGHALLPDGHDHRAARSAGRVGQRVAEKLNSGTIGGLEVLSCDSDGIKIWSREKSESLRTTAQSLTSQIETLILGVA